MYWSSLSQSVGIAALCPAVSAATLLVPQHYPTVQLALAAASDGDTVFIAPGSYLIDSPTNVSQKSIVITGSGDGVTIVAVSAHLVLQGPRAAGELVLSNCTLIGTDTVVLSHNATVRDCVFDGLPGLIVESYVTGAEARVQCCKFLGPRSSVTATASEGSTVLIDDCVFSEFNDPDEHIVPLQVGRTQPTASAVVRRCNFFCNSQADRGGALRGNPSLIEDCVFVNSSASVQGGAVALEPLSLPAVQTLITAVTGCHFFGSQAPLGGAISANPNVVPILSGCEVSNNTAQAGGGIFAVGPVIVDNSVFCGNTGGDAIVGGFYGSDNLFTDACGPDCDDDGVPDSSAIALGLVDDGDGDGIPDVCQPQFFSADLNGDCVVDGADLGLVVAGWGADTGVGDVNEDGLTDGVDLAVVLGQWTAGH